MEWGLARHRTFTAVLEKPEARGTRADNEVISTLNRLSQTESVSRVDIEGYTDVSVGGIMLLATVKPPKYVVESDYIATYAGPGDLERLVRRVSHVVLSLSPALNGNPEKVRNRFRIYAQVRAPMVAARRIYWNWYIRRSAEVRFAVGPDNEGGAVRGVFPANTGRQSCRGPEWRPCNCFE